MPTDEEYGYTIDQAGIIDSVNESWLRFAVENEAPELTRVFVLGKPLLGFIDGEETRHLYQLLIDRVRSRGVSATIPFRCDSPTLARYMLLLVEPSLGGAIGFTAVLLRAEPLPSAQPDTTVARESTPVNSCSICRKLRETGGAWLEPESAVISLGLMELPRAPRIVFTVCSDCRKTIDPDGEDQPHTHE